MLRFSGWNFFGSMSGVLKEQGVNLILNLYFGPVVNAARGVAFQLNSAMMMFLINVGIVVNPFSIKLYAKQEYEKFKKKSEFVNIFNDNYVYGKVKNKLIRDGFIYRCPFCLDVSHEYAKPTKKK